MASPGTTARRRRGRRTRPPLSRERILEKALELLDDDPDGDAELSMRVLAEALGTSPMSLYRHVRNKEDLLEGLTGLALGRLELEVPATGAWTERALAWMHGVRSQLHDYPGVVPLLRTHTGHPPAVLRLVNTLLQIVRGAGFDDARGVRAVREIMWLTFGFALMEIRSRRAFPETEVDALSLTAFPAPGSAEAAELADLLETMPLLMKGDVEETFAAAARHLVAGIEAERTGEAER